MERNDKAQLTLFLTNSCNLNCIYCYEQKDKFTMSFSCATEWIERCLNNTENSFWYICLFGGEPLLQYPLVKKICEWTWKRDWDVSYVFLLQTNGTILNEDMKSWLTTNKQRIRICLSLDGRRVTHNKNRNNSYDNIDLQFFHDTWPDMPIKMTISRHNLDTIKDDVVWLHEEGYKIRGSNFAVGEGEYTEENYECIATQLKLLAEYYIAHPEIAMAPILNIPLYLLSASKDSEQRICNLGSDKLIVVNADGSTSPCSYFSNISTNNNDPNLLLQLKMVKNKKTACYDSCVFAPICNVCYAENYTETRDIFTPSKQRCRLMKMRIMASMYVMANRIANQKELKDNDALTIKSIQTYYQQIKNELL